MKEDEHSNKIIGSAIKVHRILGSGLLESVYEECLAHELTAARLLYERQKPIPVLYDGIQMECGFRLDLLVERLVVVELKTVEYFSPIHTAQMITYLKLTGCRLGILINFHVFRLKNGIKRVVLNF
jgi:GxxExxY protein